MMKNTDKGISPSPNLKKAISYLSEAITKHPEMKRGEILAKAELRFDLTPRECEFLNNNFQKVVSL